MLSFPSQNDRNVFSYWLGVLEKKKKTDLGDDKPTYF